jgi:hypothetical protein
MKRGPATNNRVKLMVVSTLGPSKISVTGCIKVEQSAQRLDEISNQKVAALDDPFRCW